MNSASFIASDTTTQGNWPGVYGADGLYVVGSPTAYPSYATVTLFNNSEYDGWTAISPQSLETPANHAVRTSDTMDGTSDFDIDLVLTGPTAFSYYFFDGDNSSRTQTVEVLDGDTLAVLDTRSVSNGYAVPVYLRWVLTGHVKIRSIPTGGTHGNATWNGIFFDPAGTTPQTITFPAFTPGSALAATSSSGLAVSYSVTSGPATISGSAISITGAGVVTIEATQGGNATYAAATPVSQSFTTIDFAPHNMTSDTVPAPFVASSSVATAGGYAAFNAFDNASGWIAASIPAALELDTGAGNAGLLLAYKIDPGIPDGFVGSRKPNAWTLSGSNDGATWTTLDTQTGQFTSGAATPVGYILASPGTTAFRYWQLNVTANNGSTDGLVGVLNLYLYGQAGSAPTLTPQTITFPAISGQPLNSAPLTLAATASSGLAVSYSVTGPATLSGSTLTITGTGLVTVTATQAGNGTFAAAAPVSIPFTVYAQRGNISYDQIASSSRTGNGPQLLTYTTPPPAHASSSGTPGQVAFDDEGNWYWCYAENAWARTGPGGYAGGMTSPASTW